MSEVLRLARIKFEQDRSRAERKINLTVQQLDRAAAHLGESPAVPEERSDLDRVLFPDDELADLAACIVWVRDEPARKAAAQEAAAQEAQSRAKVLAEAREKLAGLGFGAEAIAQMLPEA